MSTVTTMPTVRDQQERKWILIDAENQVLGRLASRIAVILMGKDKPNYAPHLDVGDFVVVINAEKVRVTGRKETQKMYYRHSGYPGGIRSASFRQQIEKHPERVIQLAVKNMLPKNALSGERLKKLKIYAGPRHPHEAQQPAPVGEQS